jgi:multidrug efflux pump subunit AcrA (membrane-fusion protein)
MRIPRKLLLMLLMLCLAGTLLAGCRSQPESAAAEQQVVTVERGDVILDITAAGNLALSHKEDLAFEIAGTVEEVLVEEGDVVEEGQVLAQLDMSEWEDNLEVLEDAVTSTERSLLQAQINLRTAEQSLKSSQDSQDTKELALLNAQISYDTAEYNLGVAERSIVPAEAEDAQQAVDEAKAALEALLNRVEEAETESEKEAWERLVPQAQSTLRSAYATLYAIIGEYEAEQISIKRKQVEAALMSLLQAQEAVSEVAEDIALKEMQLTLTQGKLQDAEKDLEDAREALEDARNESPLITAPFDGFITLVNVEGGDEILKGTVAVQIADPTKFEADILVGEMDILQLGLGTPASVQVDAMPGMNFPAEITHISPTATIQSGVVNYDVKVELQSLVPVESTASSAQEPPAEFSAEAFYERLDQAVKEGLMTQEQVDALKARLADLSQEEKDQLIERYQQAREQYSQASAGQSRPQVEMAQGQAIQLREGLTVTVSIILQQRKNVLLVPNRAIIARGAETFVQVTKDGVTEQRSVRTGLAGWLNTEIIEGLSEGEQVVIPQQTSTTTTSSSQQRGFFMAR